MFGQQQQQYAYQAMRPRPLETLQPMQPEQAQQWGAPAQPQQQQQPHAYAAPMMGGAMRQVQPAVAAPQFRLPKPEPPPAQQTQPQQQPAMSALDAKLAQHQAYLKRMRAAAPGGPGGDAGMFGYA